MQDIYFEDSYGKLYERIEDGKSKSFLFESELGKVRHQFIKRKISTSLYKNEVYDLVTPYGYGGPIIEKVRKGYEAELVEEFNEAFKQYCFNENIISEFVRFHPILENAKHFGNVYDVTKIRKTVGTDLLNYTDPYSEEFSKSARKIIKKSLLNGIKYNVVRNPENIGSFKNIYYSTMDRNKASDYYYFGEEYFDSCLNYLGQNIILVEVYLENKVIASGFYFVFNKTIHAHLSGTLNEYLNYSPAYILKYATLEWAKDNGIELIHYGGGTSNSEEDNLYKFKKKFGKNTSFDFYVGKKIWNKDVYKELSEGVESNIDFFPLYRFHKK
ncbi:MULTISPECIES: GNAT family N-acetyltransferase [Bacillaceae]|uniref:Lipid II:glycine glycyltransferase n=1 Tax=Alkalicoccobacillus plakortidis TaxID=444060 RepID=A0A9D5DM40_9BACI|nr:MULTISPECIES: GNAT family N-acetyltransferase [Bacillaceae]KQL56484.1 hypothetical protein AN965_13580 [Alkalicoccobacillus plakortidis]